MRYLLVLSALLLAGCNVTTEPAAPDLKRAPVPACPDQPVVGFLCIE